MGNLVLKLVKEDYFMRRKVVAFIPARGGSKGIPLKNIKNIAGKPLIYWTIEAAIDCPIIDKIYVSTDSAKIKNCVESLRNEKIEVIGRSEYTASDVASSESALLEFCEKYIFDDVFFIQATSPVLDSADLLCAWEKYANCDSVVSVTRQKRFVWQEDDNYYHPINYDYFKRPRRQDFKGFLVENGAFYLSSRNNIVNSKCRISGKISVQEMDVDSYLEIDEPKDWDLVELILEKKKKSIQKSLVKSKMLVMDVDGVLTDAGMYYSESGEELKKFNTRDGKGIELIRNIGIKTAIITSENTKIVDKRAKKLNIDYVYQGVKNKAEVLLELSDVSGISIDDMIYIGDDINDLSCIEMAGISFCPRDADELVIRKADFILSKNGGEGVVREVCQKILSERRSIL